MLASQQFGLRGYIQWTRVVLPAVMHKLAYNSMISWANGWYFLIASEIIVMGHDPLSPAGSGQLSRADDVRRETTGTPSSACWC